MFQEEKCNRDRSHRDRLPLTATNEILKKMQGIQFIEEKKGKDVLHTMLLNAQEEGKNIFVSYFYSIYATAIIYLSVSLSSSSSSLSLMFLDVEANRGIL